MQTARCPSGHTLPPERPQVGLRGHTAGSPAPSPRVIPSGRQTHYKASQLGILLGKFLYPHASSKVANVALEGLGDLRQQVAPWAIVEIEPVAHTTTVDPQEACELGLALDPQLVHPFFDPIFESLEIDIGSVYGHFICQSLIVCQDNCSMRRTPIAILRESLGLSQAEFARRIGVSRQQIHGIERYGQNMNAVKLIEVRDQYPRQMRKCGLRLEDLILAKVGYRP